MSLGRLSEGEYHTVLNASIAKDLPFEDLLVEYELVSPTELNKLARAALPLLSAAGLTVMSPSNTAPDLTDTNLVSLSEIAAGFGYSSGGNAINVTASSQTTGTYSLVADDEVITASGGSIGPFRYVIPQLDG